jgi:hypothetical protein
MGKEPVAIVLENWRPVQHARKFRARSLRAPADIVEPETRRQISLCEPATVTSTPNRRTILMDASDEIVSTMSSAG